MRPEPTLGMALLLSSCVLPMRVDHLTDDFDFPDAITAVDAYTPTGDITIQGVKDASTSHLTVDYAWHGTIPELDAHVASDGTLVARIDCHNPSWYCKVNLSLTVPDTVDVVAQGHTGDLTIRTIEGVVDAETATGKVLVSQLAGPLDAHSSTGAIVGRQLTSPEVYAQTSTGNVDIVHDGGFTVLDARTSTGDVDLLVPAGTYDISAETSTGSVSVKGLVHSSAADASITGKTSTGDVRITGYTIEP